MKNKIYLFGIILVILFTLGAIFKIMHWPGASIALFISLSLFSLVFCPMAMVNSYKEEKKHAYLYWAGGITISFNFIGAMFKILHWPGAGILLTIAILIPFVLFLPAYLYSLSKTEGKNLKNLISVLFVLVFIAAMDAMLALNVSKTVLDDSALINDHYSLLAAYYEKSIDENLHDADSADIDKLTMLKKETDRLVNQIQELKKELLITVAEENTYAINDDNHINLRLVKGIDNGSVSSVLMINEENAMALKSEIDNYKKFLNQYTNNSHGDFIQKYLDTNDMEWEGNSYTWEEVHFGGTILVWALNHLTSLEFHVRMVEAEIIETITTS